MRLLHAGLRDGAVRAASPRATAAVDRQQVNDWIAGNLCRCTGYRPIVDAGSRLREPANDWFPPRSRSARALAELKDSDDIFIGTKERFFAAPAGITSLAKLYSPIPTRRWSPARPMSGCGSPSSCATCRR
jgi:xanthine dehydrogenase iron-sulfur cluster and FAD-binding subunit A